MNDDSKPGPLNTMNDDSKPGPLNTRTSNSDASSWTVSDYFAGRPTDVPLPEGWEPSAGTDPADEIVSRGWVEWVVAQVDGKDGQVFGLRYRDLLEPAEIAARLGMQPNAVYQALHRALGKAQGLEHA